MDSLRKGGDGHAVWAQASEIKAKRDSRGDIVVELAHVYEKKELAFVATSPSKDAKIAVINS